MAEKIAGRAILASKKIPGPCQDLAAALPLPETGMRPARGFGRTPEKISGE
jgi:hypothetical protein